MKIETLDDLKKYIEYIYEKVPNCGDLKLCIPYVGGGMGTTSSVAITGVGQGIDWNRGKLFFFPEREIYPIPAQSIKKIQDDDGHWYWLPISETTLFYEYLQKMEGISYSDDPDLVDEFIERFDKYRTGGGPDVVPNHFK